MNTETESNKPRPNNKRRKKGRKNKGKGKGDKKPRRPFVQQFGAGMMVSHARHGLGAVTSAHKYYVSVQFFCKGFTDTVNTRELKFTREEQARRGKIRRAFEKGKPVTLAALAKLEPKKIVHRLLGFGTIESLDDFDAEGNITGQSVYMSFPENDYVEEDIRVEDDDGLADVRIFVPREPKEDDKKKRRRR